MPISEAYKARLYPQLDRIARHFGTPFHIYDEIGIRETGAALKTAFAQAEGFREFFAVKALPNPFIMSIMRSMGFGYDCSSGPELMLARNCGAKPGDIMFTSNNTSESDFLAAADKGGCILNLDDISLTDKVPVMPELICFRYNPGDRLALDHVSIEAEPGQMIAIVGSTGCGKSTLLKVLADLYKAESGEVRYDGRTRGEIPDTVFHSSVSTVDQETVMFEDSIYNNINMWDSTVESYEVLLAARDAQIHERITREPKDYGSVMLENGRNFSGGELQRLELARALAHEPTLLLLDEFTSALDALTEDRAMKALREKGTTCVIVAHRLSTIVDCDRIYVMDRGRIVQAGTHRELYAQEGLYKTLVS